MLYQMFPARKAHVTGKKPCLPMVVGNWIISKAAPSHGNLEHGDQHPNSSPSNHVFGASVEICPSPRLQTLPFWHHVELILKGSCLKNKSSSDFPGGEERTSVCWLSFLEEKPLNTESTLEVWQRKGEWRKQLDCLRLELRARHERDAQQGPAFKDVSKPAFDPGEYGVVAWLIL